MENNTGVNRAKMYQLALFPLNNGATNVYYVIILQYIATFGSNVLALGTVFASFMVTGMRVFDAITDPIIGAVMDRTDGKFGKFRPFMVLGNAIMAIAKKHNILVLEDAAHAFGAMYKGKMIGTIGHFGAFSFHEVKNCTSFGEGGIVYTQAFLLDASAKAGTASPVDSSYTDWGILDFLVAE